ncbi:MAG: hypothetical protein ACREHV_01835, partial [Rhizomicrobium sp.]
FTPTLIGRLRSSGGMRTRVNPPKPRFALAVGVIGHRPDRLPEDMRPRIAQEIGETFEAIRTEAVAAHARHADYFSTSAPKLIVVTALAEGSDRMATEAALANGFELEAPLPFPVDEYERDFDGPGAKNLFQGFVRRARAVLELEGDRTQPGKSYAAAGLVVLDNSDILIAVWDGGAAHGRGGTTELIHEAVRRGMPVIRVDATCENPPRLHWRGIEDRHTTPMHIEDHPAVALDQALAAALDAQVRPPQNPAERQGLDRYFTERSRRITIRIEFPLLMVLMGVRWPRLGDIVLPRPEAPPEDRSAIQPPPTAIDRAFAWADAVALRFAQDFRSAVITNFLVAAIAVLVGTLNLRYPWNAIELALVFLLVLNAFIGHARRWHHRWIESREVAERLRMTAAMRAIATRALGPFGAAATWPAWYVRAIARESGLRSGRLDRDGLAGARESLLALVRSQAAYHAATATRFERLHDRLALAGQITFVAALILAAGLFVAKAFDFTMTARFIRWTIVASASLPALASASYGIRVIGDFDGSAKRSRRMKAQLDALATTIETGSVSFERLRDRAHKASDVMLGDVANWRLVVESRELEMPG